MCGQDRTRLAILTAGAFVIGLAGCGGNAKYSGFLSNYDQLQRDKTAGNALTYFNPRYQLANYNSFMIDPIRVHFAPGAEGRNVDATKLKEVVDHFGSTLRSSLIQNGYRVVNQPGNGVLRMRIALTDVRRTVGAMNIHPATKLAGLGTGGAAMEAELLDSTSRTRVAAIVDAREGNRMSLGEGFQETGHARQVVDQWVERFINRLNEAHGK